MSNIITYHYPPKDSLMYDPLKRIRVTSEGLEPLLYMIAHTIEFHRSTNVCAEAIEAEAKVFGGLAYPRIRSSHGTMNERLFAAVDEAKQLTTSTAATANTSLQRFGATGGGHLHPSTTSRGQSLHNSTGSGHGGGPIHSYAAHGNGNTIRNSSTSSSVSASTVTSGHMNNASGSSAMAASSSLVMRPPPSLLGGGGGGGQQGGYGAARSPQQSLSGGGGGTNNTRGQGYQQPSLQSFTSGSSSAAAGHRGNQQQPPSTMALYSSTNFVPKRQISAFGRPFVLVVNIGRVEQLQIASFFGLSTSVGSRRVAMEQWRFYCLKTPHAVIQMEGPPSRGGRGGTEGGDDGVGGGGSSSLGMPTIINLLSNDLAQGRAALRFIADTCFTSAVQSPSADAEAFYNSKPDGVYYDIQIEKETV